MDRARSMNVVAIDLRLGERPIQHQKIVSCRHEFVRRIKMRRRYAKRSTKLANDRQPGDHPNDSSECVVVIATIVEGFEALLEKIDCVLERHQGRNRWPPHC